MIAVAESVVTNLTLARLKDNEEPDPAGAVLALRKLHGCAKEMRQTCDDVFDNKFLRNYMTTQLFAGVIRKGKTNKRSDNDIRGALQYVISADLFDRFWKSLAIYLDDVIKVTSSASDVIDGASRIKDSTDYLYAVMLAKKWLSILGVRPRSMNLDKRDGGVTTFDPTPFQDFVRALPLDTAIKDETVRTAVAVIRELSLKEPQK